MNSIFPVLTNQISSLPFYVHSIGIQQKQNHVKREMGLPRYQIAFCLKGEGYIHLQTKASTDSNGTDNLMHDSKVHTTDKLSLKEGEAFFLKKGQAHAYGPIQDNLVVKWLIFEGVGIETTLDSLGFKAFMKWSLNDLPGLDEKFQAIYDRLISHADPAQYQVSSMLYSLLLFLKKDYELPDLNSNFARSEPMVAYMEQHYRDDISLEMIADTIQRSVYQACKIFKRDTQTTMLKYLEDIRMKHAKRLLLQDNFTNIEKVAGQVGYRSGNYFCRVFKKNEGLTPIQFRDSMRGRE